MTKQSIMDITRRGAPNLEDKKPFVMVKDSSVEIRAPNGQSLLQGPVETLARASTGSGTFVYRVRSIYNEYVVLKVAKQARIGYPDSRQAARYRNDRRQKQILAGLKHEREVYKLFTILVKKNITPFVLMYVDIAVPDNVITTESDKKGNILSLSQYLRTHFLSYRQARTLIFQLVYTIEVFYRIGARHNDIHLGNVMMVKQPGGSRKTMRIIYLSRQFTEHIYDLPMFEWQPRIYDFDRVFKSKWPRLVATQLQTQGRMLPNVINEFANRLATSPSAVTNRFPWHDEKINTADFNVMKVLQHIRNAANRNQNRNLTAAIADLTLTRRAIIGLKQMHGLNNRTWFDYYIPESRRTQKETNISQSLKSPEDMILMSLGPQFKGSRKRRPDLTVSMHGIYKSSI